MILASHIATGALIGRYAPSAGSAFWRGFASHALLDILPHEDVKHSRREVRMAAALVALVAARQNDDGRKLAGALGGALPDLEHILPWTDTMGSRNKVYPTHLTWLLHDSLPLGFKFTVPVQLLTAGVILTWLARFRR